MNFRELWNRESVRPIKFSWFITWTLYMILAGFVMGLALGVGL